MHSVSRPVAALLVGLLPLAGCTPPWSPAPVPTPSATSPSVVPGQVVTISAVPGREVDRPRLGPSTARPDGFADAPAGAGLAGYLAQKLTWSACGELECTDLLVPLDYANPGEQAITVSLARVRATRTPRLGTLFVNPGGPGGSGKDLAGVFDRDGLEQYDIVGWDPRGTGDSTPVVCTDDAQTEALNLLDSSPDNPAEAQALIVASYEFAKACWANSGELLGHVSTIDTVRDLDLLRRLVGDKKLNYLGYSYGTRIGAVYAELFPATTGRLVLDAAVDITDDEEVIQAMGFDLALANFATWCAGQDCRLGSTKAAVLSRITGFLDELDARPQQVGGRVLTQSLATVGIAAYLYGGTRAWPALARDLSSALEGRGARLVAASDALNDRDADGHYGSMYYSFLAVSCSDDDDQGVADAERLWQEDQRKAPIFAKYFGPGVLCPLWPVRSRPQLTPRGVGAAPLLVIGATGDPATPYQQAVTMAGQLASGVLVTWEGEGHGTYGGQSACVDRIVVGYLTRGTVPADGVRCR